MTVRIGGNKWVNLFDRPFGTNGVWTFASRNPNPPETCEDKQPDAVFIAAVIDEPGQPLRHVVTSEYRVPVGGFVMGFPAGLIAPGETAIDAAVREFKEETGLEFLPGRVSPLNLYATPGLADESVQVVFGTARGQVSSDFLESGENIKTFLLSVEELVPVLLQDKPFGSIGWDSKTWSILAAFAGISAKLYLPAETENEIMELSNNSVSGLVP